MKPRIATALTKLLVLLGVAEEDAMAEPLKTVKDESHDKGDERQEAEADGSTEDGREAKWEGKKEGDDLESSEDFRNGCSFGHFLAPPGSRLKLGG